MYTSEDNLRKLNGLMSVSDFISGPAAEECFRTLCIEIRMLARPHDRFTLPDPCSAGAWRKAWEIYIRLRDRNAIPPSPELDFAEFMPRSKALP
jgi:hypothetical protein